MIPQGPMRLVLRVDGSRPSFAITLECRHVEHRTEWRRGTTRLRCSRCYAGPRPSQANEGSGRPRTHVRVGEALALKAEGRTWDDVAQLLQVSRATLLRAVAAQKEVTAKP